MSMSSRKKRLSFSTPNLSNNNTINTNRPPPLHSRHSSEQLQDIALSPYKDMPEEPPTQQQNNDSRGEEQVAAGAGAATAGTSSGSYGRATGRQLRDPDEGAPRLRDRGYSSHGSGSIKKKSWLKTKIDNYKSIELENKASVARDHLALERTFLAWLRTSLAFASIGVAVTQLFRLNSTISPDQPHHGHRNENLRHMGRPLGATFLGIAIVVLILGMHRYFESQTWLLKGKFPASRGSILILTLIAALLIVASLVIVLVIKPA